MNVTSHLVSRIVKSWESGIFLKEFLSLLDTGNSTNFADNSRGSRRILVIFFWGAGRLTSNKPFRFGTGRGEVSRDLCCFKIPKIWHHDVNRMQQLLWLQTPTSLVSYPEAREAGGSRGTCHPNSDWGGQCPPQHWCSATGCCLTCWSSLVSVVHKAVRCLDVSHTREQPGCYRLNVADACASGRPIQLQYTMHSARVGGHCAWHRWRYGMARCLNIVSNCVSNRSRIVDRNHCSKSIGIYSIFAILFGSTVNNTSTAGMTCSWNSAVYSFTVFIPCISRRFAQHCIMATKQRPSAGMRTQRLHI